MLLAIAGFELRRRVRLLSSYVYALVLFACGFLTMIAAGGAFSSVSVGLGADKVHANAPTSLNGLVTIFCHVGVLITAAVFGQALHQDRETGMSALFFSAPVRKVDYLGGRFLGALVFSLAIYLAVAAGLWTGTWMPFVEKAAFGPNHAAAYLWPYVTTVLPNLVFTGALFFALAGLGRQMLPVYVGAVILVVGYLTAGSLFSRLEYRTLAALLDPFGMTATRLLVEYRTVAEQNALLVPLSGIFLVNRLLWLGVGAALLALTALRFRLTHEGTVERRAGALPTDVVAAPKATAPPVVVAPGGALRLLGRLTWLSFRETVKDVWFGVIVFAGVLFMVIASLQASALYGTPTWPVTWAVLETTSGTFGVFVLVLITFYSGELVWRERDARIHLITDALPTPTWLAPAAKLGALLLMLAVLLAVLVVAGIGIQLGRGYTRFELGLYLEWLYGLRFVEFAYLAVLAVFVHVIVNHKYVGHFVMVLYYLWTLFLPKLGLEHNLVHYGSQPDIQYSDMNRFGHWLGAVAWFDVYWAFVALLLAVASHLLWPRGVVEARGRLREARRRAGAAVRFAAGLGVAGAALTGGYVYWNTNVRNVYRTSAAREREQAEYERRYRPDAARLQPRIAAVDVALDIHPRGARGNPAPALHAHGTYTLRNPGAEPIRTVHVELPAYQPFERLAVGGSARPTRGDLRFGVYEHDLDPPLAPGASTELAFDAWFQDQGFENRIGNTEVVENGTFFHSSALPAIGYDENGELAEDGARKKYGLPPKARVRDLDDAEGKNRNYVARDSDWIDLRVTVSTTPDQLAIAPGTLEKQWTEATADGPRVYSRFVTDRKILGFYSVLSARYAVRKDSWNGLPLEIDYHPTHDYDLDRMFAGMKDALTYCSDAFGPYQHRQARILEFPRYAAFAQSFPNTIPYSEAIGFIAKVDDRDPKDVDFPYYVTAHEIAHQWWAHQVVGANVQGATMLSETLAQYSALMVMKHKYGTERMRRFLAYELDRYLSARSFERKREVPLLRVENQPYIHYAKGSLVMYALQDYAGEETVNRALHAFVEAFRDRGPPYPTSRDLVAALRRELPAELHGLLTDLVETITLFDDRAESATYRARPDGTYEVSVKVVARKVRADELGVEHDEPLDLPIDIGALDEDGNVIFREKRRIASGPSEHTFVVPRLPAKAGIDPLNVLVDRKPDDNVVRITRAE